METRDAIRLAGGVTALAELLDITPSAVSQWEAEVPDARVWQLKVLRPEWFKRAKEEKAAESEKA